MFNRKGFMRYHLAILKKQYLDAILNGTKTIESRFTMNRCEPFGRICTGDVVILKQSSGAVRARAKVTQVLEYENLTPTEIDRIRLEFGGQIGGTDEYWQSKRQCNYGVLVWLDDVKQIEQVDISKKDWRAWVVLTESKNWGLIEKFAG